MRNRFENALFINYGGACNPSGIAHSIVDACKEMRDEPTYTGTDEMRRDPAIGLMIHQLCHLYGIVTDDCAEGFIWGNAIADCVAKADLQLVQELKLEPYLPKTTD